MGKSYETEPKAIVKFVFDAEYPDGERKPLFFVLWIFASSPFHDYYSYIDRWGINGVWKAPYLYNEILREVRPKAKRLYTLLDMGVYDFCR